MGVCVNGYGRGEKDLTHDLEIIGEVFLAMRVEGIAEIVESDERGIAEAVFESLPFREAKSRDGSPLLPFAGESFGSFGADPKGEIVAMRAIEGCANLFFAGAHFLELL